MWPRGGSIGSVLRRERDIGSLLPAERIQSVGDLLQRPHIKFQLVIITSAEWSKNTIFVSLSRSQRELAAKIHIHYYDTIHVVIIIIIIILLCIIIIIIIIIITIIVVGSTYYYILYFNMQNMHQYISNFTAASIVDRQN